MAKVLVLMFGKDASLATVTDAVMTGAKSVRFTETILRVADHAIGRMRVLEDDDLSAADGVALVVAPDGADAFASFVDRIAANASLQNTVFGVMANDHAAVGPLVAAGGIVISAPGAADAEATGRALGERVARVAGWVRHALGHEAEHAQHGHAHSHDHAHDSHGGHDHHAHGDQPHHGHPHEHLHDRP